MHARLLLSICAAPAVYWTLDAVYWTLDAVCRVSGLTCGYTGDHIRLYITFTVCALLLAHSLRPNRSSRLGKERS